MWLGDRITEKGLGNGISVLITVGILSGAPGAVSQLYYLIRSTVGSRVFVYETSHLFLMMLLLGFVVAAMVAMTQAQRKIPVQYAKRVVGRKIYGGQASFMPLKINYSGIMPVIFASALIMFPQQIFAYLAGASGSKFFQRVALALTQGSWTYYLMFGTLIMAFSYFWVSMMFKPVQIADELKKNGGYIPGVRPGEATARFLDYIMTRLTFAGSVFLTLIALMPDALYFACSIPYSVATFFGGTGTLITVGVMLETMRQAETYFVQRRYDAFMGQRSKAPSLMGRALAPSSRVFDGIETDQLKRLWRPLIILFVFGILASLYRLL
jgi:preprotein translocase subunit SecY